jgi:hypothetical protein
VRLPVQIITANSLGDGRVVFQTVTGWSRKIGEAQRLESDEAAAAALARANADAAVNRVVEPYLIEVRDEAGRLVAVRLRERIRADGPTTGHSTPNYHGGQRAA